MRKLINTVAVANLVAVSLVVAGCRAPDPADANATSFLSSPRDDATSAYIIRDRGSGDYEILAVRGWLRLLEALRFSPESHYVHLGRSFADRSAYSDSFMGGVSNRTYSSVYDATTALRERRVSYRPGYCTWTLRHESPWTLPVSWYVVTLQSSAVFDPVECRTGDDVIEALGPALASLPEADDRRLSRLWRDGPAVYPGGYVLHARVGGGIRVFLVSETKFAAEVRSDADLMPSPLKEVLERPIVCMGTAYRERFTTFAQALRAIETGELTPCEGESLLEIPTYPGSAFYLYQPDRSEDQRAAE